MMASTSVTLGLKLLKAYWHVSKPLFLFTDQTETHDHVKHSATKPSGGEGEGIKKTLILHNELWNFKLNWRKDTCGLPGFVYRMI